MMIVWSLYICTWIFFSLSLSLSLSSLSLSLSDMIYILEKKNPKRLFFISWIIEKTCMCGYKNTFQALLIDYTHMPEMAAFVVHI